MSDCAWWEQVSASADGELTETERATADAHTATCPDCAASLKATALLRPAPRTATTPAPSRPAGIDANQLTSQERRWLSGRWARRLLLVAAVIIVLEAIPAYISGDGPSAESHAARHLAAWQIGFGVGLVVAAWVSRMSHAMLAFAATFAALTVVATGIDVIGGHSGPLAEPVHLVELIGVFLLWRLTPPHLLPWHRTNHSTSRHVTPPTRNELRLVNTDSGKPETPQR
jgi:predicted anti-sigma-YlaC factor YlaD